MLQDSRAQPGSKTVRSPDPREGSVPVEALLLGVYGTDREIVAGKYGAAPPRGARGWCPVTSPSGGCWTRRRPAASPPEISVVGIVRHPDPVPCANCAAGEWDMCRNGRYTEHGRRVDRPLTGGRSRCWRPSWCDKTVTGPRPLRPPPGSA